MVEAKSYEVHLWSAIREITQFIIRHQGIEANSKQIKAVVRMGPPQLAKDIQNLIGCITTLHRFISRLEERGLSFFKLLKRAGKFKWTNEPDAGFQNLNNYKPVDPHPS